MTEPAALPFLPFALPEIADDETAAVIDTMDSGAAVCSFSVNRTFTSCEGGLLSRRNNVLAGCTCVMGLHSIGREASLTALRGPLAR